MAVVSYDPMIASNLPVSPDQVWAPMGFQLADWTPTVILHSEWQTRVAEAQDVSEERRCYTSKPNRVLIVSFSTLNAKDTTILRALMARTANARSLIPLYCDVTKLSVAATSGQSTIHCDTTNRRFYPGARVGIVDIPEEGVTSPSFEVRIIDSITTSTIVLDTPLGGDHSIGAKVYPLMDCQIILQLAKVTIISDGLSAGQLTFAETVGITALDPLIDVTDSLDYPLDSWTGMYVLDTVNDWTSTTFSYVRAGLVTPAGLGTKTVVRGNRAAVVQDFQMTCLTREKTMRFLRFWDWHRGMGQRFLLPTWTSDFEFIDSTGPVLHLKATGSSFDWALRGFIGILLRDGTWIIGSINGSSRTGDVDEILCGANMTADPTLVRKVCLVSAARFDVAEIVENWITDEVCTITGISIKELINETNFDLAPAELNQTVGDNPFDV